MKTRIILFALVSGLWSLASSSCTLPATEGANPLDRPYDRQSAEAIREGHMQKITSNPGYRLP